MSIEVLRIIFNNWDHLDQDTQNKIKDAELATEKLDDFLADLERYYFEPGTTTQYSPDNQENLDIARIVLDYMALTRGNCQNQGMELTYCDNDLIFLIKSKWNAQRAAHLQQEYLNLVNAVNQYKYLSPLYDLDSENYANLDNLANAVHSKPLSNHDTLQVFIEDERTEKVKKWGAFWGLTLDHDQ